MTTNSHFTAHLNDYYARIREYVEGVQVDDYTVHVEDGDWRATIPNGASLNVYRQI